MENNNNTTWIIGGVVLVLLILAGVLLFAGPETDEIPNNDDENTEEQDDEFESVSGDEANSVIVNTQLPGDVVFYRNLTLEEDGFVVVRTEENNEPGEVIGTAFHEAGENMTGNVELEEQTAEGERYYIELHNDTNETGIFEENEDEVVTTSGGDEIRVRIETTEDLPEQKG